MNKIVQIYVNFPFNPGMVTKNLTLCGRDVSFLAIRTRKNTHNIYMNIHLVQFVQIFQGCVLI